MEAKSSSRMLYFGRFLTPLFANCVNATMMFVHVSEREILFSLNLSQFAVIKNQKISKLSNIGFFWEEDKGFF